LIDNCDICIAYYDKNLSNSIGLEVCEDSTIEYIQLGQIVAYKMYRIYVPH